MNDTLRINGQARVTVDEEILGKMSVRGRCPKSGLIIKVEEVFMHCAKALIRSHLWDTERHIERSSFPTLGQMFKDQIADIEDADEADKAIQEGYVSRLY